ncbi:MAG TPA: A/G-specific adenine glycosylase [Candidatus Acidoferrum sp.]|nr:A/G-specific adenine glycosylase [Candidatus Acidoferrum sp.]
MNLSGRELATFRKSLLAWFRQFQRELPWRKSKDPYRVWLSEIMLQQTRVAAVIPYYERFLERFPDVKSLAAAPEEEVLRLWSGLGYYSRARNLQKAALQVMGEFGGQFPQQREKILSLAGIGDYTASAIASIALDEKCAVLDGNVARVLARLGTIHGDLREARRWKELQAQADHLLDPSAPGDWNQAMMELGATLCTPSSPQCLLCPVATFCEARKLGVADLLPEAKKKRDFVDVKMASIILVDDKNRTLLLPPPAKNNPDDLPDHVPTLLSNLWHFPTIPVSGDPAKAAEAAWKKLFHGALPKKRLALPVVRHSVTYRKLTVHAFLAQVPRLPKLSSATFFLLKEVTSLAISSLTRKLTNRALAALKKSPH